MSFIAYKDVDRLLVSAVPELAEIREQELKRWGNEQPGQYNMLSVLLPLVDRTIDSNSDIDQLQRIFSFFEEMAQSQDVDVVNLLQVGVLEKLIANAARLSKAWGFMGPVTRKLTKETARIWNREANVPARH
jgi:hypothetical protein